MPNESKSAERASLYTSLTDGDYIYLDGDIYIVLDGFDRERLGGIEVWHFNRAVKTDLEFMDISDANEVGII